MRFKSQVYFINKDSGQITNDYHYATGDSLPKALEFARTRLSLVLEDEVAHADVVRHDGSVAVHFGGITKSDFQPTPEDVFPEIEGVEPDGC